MGMYQERIQDGGAEGTKGPKNFWKTKNFFFKSVVFIGMSTKVNNIF